MRDGLVGKIIGVVLMLVTPAAMLMAESSNAMLYAKGSVLLNGAAVERSTSVSAGDQIQTAGESAVAVNTTGSTITVDPYSTVKYGQNSIELVKGTASVKTTDGMPTRVAGVSIAPADKSATYEVARLENKLLVTSRDGALAINEAGRTSTVNTGETGTVALDPAPAPQAPAASATGNGTITNPTNFHWPSITHKQAIIIGAIVGGAAVACGLLCGTASAQSDLPGFSPAPASVTPVAAKFHLAGVAHLVAAHPGVAKVVTTSVRNVGQQKRATASHMAHH